MQKGPEDFMSMARVRREDKTFCASLASFRKVKGFRFMGRLPCGHVCIAVLEVSGYDVKCLTRSSLTS